MLGQIYAHKQFAAAPGESCLSAGTLCTGGCRSRARCCFSAARSAAIALARCVQGFCACDPDYQPIGGLCQPIVPSTFPIVNGQLPPGATCDPRCAWMSSCPARCGGGSVCVDSVCCCPQNQQAVDGICVPLPVGTFMVRVGWRDVG